MVCSHTAPGLKRRRNCNIVIKLRIVKIIFTVVVCIDLAIHWDQPDNRLAGYIAIEVVKGINHDAVEQFSKRKLLSDQIVYTDGFPALTSLAKTQTHEARPTPAEKVDEWLPWVHIVISNLKRFLLGTFHDVQGKYLQEYNNEFCYRFNRRRWEPEISARLLAACATHLPLKSC